MSQTKKTLIQVFAEVLKTGPDEIAAAESFRELGVSSLNAVEILQAINIRFDTALPTSVAFECPDLDSLAAYLDRSLPVRKEAATSTVRDRLVGLFAVTLAIGRDEIEKSESFRELGISSLNAVELLEAVNGEFGLTLPTSVAFECPDVAALAAYIEARLPQGKPAQLEARADAPLPKAPVLRSIPARDPHPSRRPERPVKPAAYGRIAIVGLSCRCAGARNQAEFWDLVSRGRDCIGPLDNPEWRAYFRAHGYPDIALRFAALEGMDEFDPLFFRISPKEAEAMDVSQRILLQESYRALEDAGIAPRSLGGKPVGTFIGTMGILPMEQDFSHHYMAGSDTSILAARLAYFLNLKGPSLAINTACSSSLVAVDMASQKLLSGEIDLAIAGGITIYTHPGVFISMHNAGMLSPSGRCRPFDDDADGILVGDGVGVVILKRFEDAVRDGNPIYGLIRGAGVNQDGQTAGITVPSFISQSLLEQSVYERAGISPEDIQYIETHGTGTKLGDPIEIHALTEAFAKSTARKGFCAIGSVKGNIGHTTAAAGALGLIKLLLSMKHGRIPPSVNFAKGNRHIDFANTPFYVNRTLTPWPAPSGGARLAAISSFGFSGTNSHMLIEEYPGPDCHRQGPSREGSAVFVLSAASRTSLAAGARRMLDHLSAEGEEIPLHALCHTLQTSRDAMEHRLAIVSGDVLGLAQGLSDYLSESIRQGSYSLHTGVAVKAAAKDSQEPMITATGAMPDQDALARDWAKGASVDWASFRIGAPMARLGLLPTYEFAREIMPRARIVPLRNGEGAARPLHPLAHRNVSDFSSQAYESAFTGNEFFLDHHKVAGKRVLPGVAYLEMAHFAYRNAAEPWRQEGDRITLRSVAWSAPFLVDEGGTTLRITLAPAGEEGWTEFEVSSGAAPEGDRLSHCKGRIGFVPGIDDAGRLDIETLVNACSIREIASADLYDAFRGFGLDYGPGHRALERIHVGQGQALARLRLPGFLESGADTYELHPSLLDSALQASAAFLLSDGRTGSGGLAIPFAVEEVDVIGPCNGPVWAHLRSDPGTGGHGRILKVDVDLCGDDGSIRVRMRGFAFKEFQGFKAKAKEPATAIGRLLFEPEWVEKPAGVSEVSAASAPSGNDHVVLLLGGLETPPGLDGSVPTGTRIIGFQTSGKDAADMYRRTAGAVAAEMRSILSAKPTRTCLVQIISPSHAEAALNQGLLGLIKTAALENPLLQGQLIMVDPGAPGFPGLSRIIRENLASPGGIAIRYAHSGREEQDWKEAAAGDGRASAPWKDGGVYLISGGAGGIGLLLAGEIADKVSNAKVVLVGRSALTETTRKRLDGIRAKGASIGYRRTDIEDAASVEAVVSDLLAEHGTLDGILHCAGCKQDGFLIRKSPEEFDLVLAPKVAGAVNLDRASKDLSLDFFLLFSSLAAVGGNVGQADYAAANGFLDAFAEYRASMAARGERKGRSLSVDWSLWRDGGMQVDGATMAIKMGAMGLTGMSTESCMQALYQSFSLGSPRIAVMEGDVARLRAMFAPDGQAAAPIARTGFPEREVMHLQSQD